MQIGENIFAPPQYRLTPSFIWHKGVSFVGKYFEMTEMRFVCLYDPPRKIDERDYYATWTFHVDLAWESKKSRHINDLNCRVDVIEKSAGANDIIAYDTTGSPELIGNTASLKDWKEFWILIIERRISVAAWLQKPRNVRSKEFLLSFSNDLAEDFPREPIHAVQGIFPLGKLGSE
jgi:hypothetical protein